MRRKIVAILVAVMLLMSGCSFLSPSQETPTRSPTDTVTDHHTVTQSHTSSTGTESPSEPSVGGAYGNELTLFDVSDSIDVLEGRYDNFTIVMYRNGSSRDETIYKYDSTRNRMLIKERSDGELTEVRYYENSTWYYKRLIYHKNGSQSWNYTQSDAFRDEVGVITYLPSVEYNNESDVLMSGTTTFNGKEVAIYKGDSREGASTNFTHTAYVTGDGEIVYWETTDYFEAVSDVTSTQYIWDRNQTRVFRPEWVNEKY